jgi:hypothetical protein
MVSLGIGSHSGIYVGCITAAVIQFGAQHLESSWASNSESAFNGRKHDMRGNAKSKNKGYSKVVHHI